MAPGTTAARGMRDRMLFLTRNRSIANGRPTTVNCVVTQAPNTTGYRGSMEPTPNAS